MSIKKNIQGPKPTTANHAVSEALDPFNLHYADKAVKALFFAMLVCLISWNAAHAQQRIPAAVEQNPGSIHVPGVCQRMFPITEEDSQREGFLIYLPFLGGRPTCPQVEQGAAAVAIAGDGSNVWGVLNTGAGERVWYVSDQRYSFITDRRVISPTVSVEALRSLADQPAPGASQSLIGVWPVTLEISGTRAAADVGPGDWLQYFDGEMIKELDARPLTRMRIPSYAKLSQFPIRGTQLEIGEICPLAIGQSFWVEYAGFVLDLTTMTWMVEIRHSEGLQPNLVTLCGDYMREYKWMVATDFLNLLPRNVFNEMRDNVRSRTTGYQRNTWSFPSLGNLQPEPVAATIAATALGGGVYVWVQYASGGGGLMLFAPSMTVPNAVN